MRHRRAQPGESRWGRWKGPLGREALDHRRRGRSRTATAPTPVVIVAATGAVPGLEVPGDHDADGLHPAWHVDDTAQAALGEDIVVGGLAGVPRRCVAGGFVDADEKVEPFVVLVVLPCNGGEVVTTASRQARGRTEFRLTTAPASALTAGLLAATGLVLPLAATAATPSSASLTLRLLRSVAGGFRRSLGPSIARRQRFIVPVFTGGRGSLPRRVLPGLGAVAAAAAPAAAPSPPPATASGLLVATRFARSSRPVVAVDPLRGVAVVPAASAAWRLRFQRRIPVERRAHRRARLDRRSFPLAAPGRVVGMTRTGLRAASFPALAGSGATVFAAPARRSAGGIGHVFPRADGAIVFVGQPLVPLGVAAARLRGVVAITPATTASAAPATAAAATARLAVVRCPFPIVAGARSAIGPIVAQTALHGIATTGVVARGAASRVPPVALRSGRWCGGLVSPRPRIVRGAPDGFGLGECRPGLTPSRRLVIHGLAARRDVVIARPSTIVAVASAAAASVATSTLAAWAAVSTLTARRTAILRC